MYGEYIIVRSRSAYEKKRPVIKKVLASSYQEAARKFVAVMTGKLVKDVTSDGAMTYLFENDFSDPIQAEAVPEP